MSNRLDSRALAQFVAVAQVLSFRVAAESLHMSQPPLSRAIRQLEDRLGARLFERDTQGVELTATGRVLLPRARKILALLDQAEALVTSAPRAGRLRIGLTSAIEPSWFAGMLGCIQRLRHDAEVTMLSDSSPRLVRALRGHRLDAAFIALPTESAGLDVSLLDRQPMVVALAASHTLARRRSIALADLDGQSLFMFERSRQPAFFDHCQAVFTKHGVVPRAVREPSDHPVLLAEVAAGRALALLPQSFTALRRAGVAYRPLKEGSELAVGVGLVLRHGEVSLRGLLWQCAKESGLGEAAEPPAAMRVH